VLALSIMMNVGTRFLLTILAFYVASVMYESAFADITPQDYNLSGAGKTVEFGETLYGGTINIANTLTIINHGSVYGTINVCDNCDLYVENTNSFNASVNLGNNSTITQVIKNADDITSLGTIGVDYSVWVKDTADTLNWNDILNNTSGATKYKLEHAEIYVNNIGITDNVVVDGDVIVYVDIPANSDVILFTNLYENAPITVLPTTSDSLYVFEPYNVSGALHIRTIRSNDYARILNNDTGLFLNNLRNIEPDDALLSQLDSAKTVGDLNRVMDKSVKIHPIKMMHSVKTIYSHEMLETMHIARNDGMGIMPKILFSDGLRAIGVQPYLNINPYDDLHVKLSGNIFNLKYLDDINSYTAMSYGFGADVIYDLPSDNFLRAYGGINLSTFDAGLVFDGNGATEKPHGISGYLVGEFGHRFDIDEGYYISPFVMLGGDYATILNTDDLDYYVGTGGDVGFNFEFDGFRYDYAARGIVRSDCGIGAELNISIWSLADSAGAGLRAGAFYDDVFNTSYHIALDAKFNF